MKIIYVILILLLLAGCAPGTESPPILVYLPTFTPTATATPTLTVTPRPTLTPVPEPPKTPTLTPEPWLHIELSISDASTGAAVAADIYAGVFVDDQIIGELIEENVSETVINLPRGLTRADVVFINITAEGYRNRFIRLPKEAKTEPALKFEVQLVKSAR
jgi:hypothetical protein